MTMLPPGLKTKISEIVEPEIQQFSELISSYHRKVYMLKTFPAVLPIEYHLGSTSRLSESIFNRHMQEMPHCLYYIPVKETISALLQHTSFVEFLCSPRNMQANDCFVNFNDGNVYKDHPLFSNDTQSLQVILYYDDVTVSNVIGSRTTLNKLAFFYVSFCNLPLHLRSQLKLVYLWGVVKVTHLLKYGYDVVLEPFFNKMRKFYNDGFTFTLKENCTVKVQGALALVIGDTLAAHQLLGLKEGVRFANKKCRNCLTRFDQMQVDFTEDCFEMRNIAFHTVQCDMLAVNAHASVQYGINRPSQFFNISHFDPFKCFPQDAMHVLLEGCLPHTIKHMLVYYIKSVFFSLRDLNRKIETFPYFHSDTPCKPSPILDSHLKDGKLNQTASQMWLLSQLLPFYVADYIDFETDEKWKCFSILLRLCALYFCHVLLRIKWTVFG